MTADHGHVDAIGFIAVAMCLAIAVTCDIVTGTNFLKQIREGESRLRERVVS